MKGLRLFMKGITFESMRYRLITLFLSLSLIFALFSIPVSGALSGDKLDRSAAAWVAGDKNAALTINGLSDATYDLDNKYSNIGIITNNTNHEIILCITVTADFLSTQSRNCILGFKIGSQTGEIINNGINTTNLTVTLPPLKAVNFQAFLDRNQNHAVTATFSYTATNTDGSLSMQLNDTPDTPRRISCY
jgi:hypothetical protein